MSLTENLYKELILEHARQPSHCCELEQPTVREEGVNRSCGDEVELELDVQEGMIKHICVNSRGCSISVASGSIMAESVEGLSTEQAESLIETFKSMIISEEEPELPDDFASLVALRGVRKYPIRVKCATLSWSTLDQALRKLNTN